MRSFRGRSGRDLYDLQIADGRKAFYRGRLESAHVTRSSRKGDPGFGFYQDPVAPVIRMRRRKCHGVCPKALAVVMSKKRNVNNVPGKRFKDAFHISPLE